MSHDPSAVEHQPGEPARGFIAWWHRTPLYLRIIAALILGVLGGIYGGLFSATEAAAVGALGALLLAVAKRRLSLTTFWKIVLETGQVTGAILILIVGASIYSRMLALTGIPNLMDQSIRSLGLGFYGFLALYIAVLLILGTLMDSISTMLITVPLALPIMVGFNADLIWFGIVTVIAVEIGLLTPPFGLSVFVIKSSLDDQSIALGDVFKGALPFAFIMLLVLGLIVAFPKLATVFVS